MVSCSFSLGAGVLGVSFFLYMSHISALASSTTSPFGQVVHVFFAFCAGLLPFLYFSTRVHDPAGRLLAYGVLLFATGYACLGASLMPRE